MTEYDVVNLLEELRREYGTPKEFLCRKAGWYLSTYRSYINGETSMSIQAIADFFGVYGCAPAIIEKTGYTHVGEDEISKYLSDSVNALEQDKKQEIYDACSINGEKCGKQNFKKWTSGEISIKLKNLMPILSVLGADFCIVYDSALIYM